MSDLPARIASLSAAKRELLARRMRRAAAEAPDAIAPRQGEAPVPLAPMQERLWLMEQIHGGRAAYNLSQAFRLRGPLNAAALERAFEALLARHESLRTTFHGVEGQALQVVGDPWPFSLPVVSAESADQAARLAGQEAQHVSVGLGEGAVQGTEVRMDIADDLVPGDEGRCEARAPRSGAG